MEETFGCQHAGVAGQGRSDYPGLEQGIIYQCIRYKIHYNIIPSANRTEGQGEALRGEPNRSKLGSAGDD